MIELFIELVDSLYFQGYVEEMALNNPEKFYFEYNDFLENYGSGLFKS